MWAFPSFEGARSEKDVREALAEMGVIAGRGRRLDDAEHAFTHRVWKMKGWRFDVREFPAGENFRPVDSDGLREAALPTAFRAYRSAAEEMLTAQNEDKQND